MKKLYRILIFCFLFFSWEIVAKTASGEGEIDGCGEDEVDCKTCINNALRQAKQQVSDSDRGASGSSSSSGTRSE